MNKVRRLVSILLIVLLLFNSIAIAESANINPELIINNADKVNVVLGNNYKLDGYIKDQNAEDQLSLKYSIKKDGTVLQNYNSKELLSVASTSENQSINSMSIDVTGLAYGEYEVDLWVVDNQGASSSVITKTFVYSEMFFDPVIDKFNITQTTNGASFEFEGHSDQYALIDKPYQINVFDNRTLVSLSKSIQQSYESYDFSKVQSLGTNRDFTYGNNNRKISRLDNGWWVMLVTDTNIPNVKLMVSKDNFASEPEQLCYVTNSDGGIILSSATNHSMTTVGNRILLIVGENSGVKNKVLFFNVDAETQENTNIFSSAFIIDANKTGLNGTSIAVNEFHGENKISVAWSCQNTQLYNSNNINVLEGTITNGVVTWGQVEALTTISYSSQSAIRPSIIYNPNNQPVVVYEFINGVESKILLNGKSSDTGTWNDMIEKIFDGQGYKQSQASIVSIPSYVSKKINSYYSDGLMILTWHGWDNENSAVSNIRCKASLNYGDTWFDFGETQEKLTTNNLYNQIAPTLSWNQNGEIFVMWAGQHDVNNPSRYDIFKKKYLFGWLEAERITDTSSTGSSYYPNSIDNFHDFELPMTIWKQAGSNVKFYGKWTVGEPGGTYSVDGLLPNTTYKGVLSVTNVLNNVSTMEKYFTTLAEVSVISEVSTSSDTLTFKVLDNNAYRTGYKVYVNDEYVNMFGEISSNDSEWYRMSVDDLSGEKRFTVRGLTPGTEYTISVKSRNHDGIETDLSNALVLTTSNVSPAGVVSSISSSATRETVSLSWDPVEYASSYIVKINDVTTEVNVNSLSISSGDIAGLDIVPDTVYKVSVAAKNAVSTTEYSLPVTVKTLLPKPAVPSLSIVSSSNNSVSLSWPELTNVNRYELEVDGRLVDMHLDNFYKHMGLVKSSQHAYRIRSYNADGMSDWSPVIVVKTSASDVVGALQSGVEKKSNASITLSWDAVPNAVRYYVQLDEGDVLKSSGNLYTIFGGLKPSTSYHLRVYAGDEETYHEAAILDINTTTHLLSTPVIVSVPVDEKFKIDWDDIEGATSYEVVFNDDVNTLVTVSGSEYITDISSLENMNTVKVRAVSSTGDSGYSNILSIILKEKLPISPNDLKYISGEDFVLLTWSDNDNSLYYDLEVDGAVIESIERDKYLHDGLTAFSEHKYRIRSKSEMMEGLWSQFLEIITLPTKPLPPSGVVIKNTRSTATLSWDEVPSAEGYEVKVNEDKVYKLGTQTTYTHRGIPLNKEQTYRVRTSNIIGESSWSHLIVNNSLRALCQRDSTIDLGLTASNVDDFSKYTLRVTYNPDVLEVTDLCGYTSDIELEAGHIESEDITVTEFEEVLIDGVKTGVITFKVSKPVEEGYSWTGILNNIKFNPKLTGITYLTYTVLIDEEKSGGHHE